MITTEDGTGLTGANSYATLEQAAAYNLIRKNDAWADATPENQEAALVRATDLIEATYSALAPRRSHSQSLQWPVGWATAVPAQIVAATIVLALSALNGPLIAPAVRGIKESTKILDGVGELTTKYDDAPADPYPTITSMLMGVARLRSQNSTGALIMGRLVR